MPTKNHELLARIAQIVDKYRHRHKNVYNKAIHYLMSSKIKLIFHKSEQNIDKFLFFIDGAPPKYSYIEIESRKNYVRETLCSCQDFFYIHTTHKERKICAHILSSLLCISNMLINDKKLLSKYRLYPYPIEKIANYKPSPYSKLLDLVGKN